MAVRTEDAEILQCIDHHRLMGRGLGYIDMHLLISAILTRAPLWTLDRRLREVTQDLGLTR